MIRFDDETHTYYDENDKVVPGVTTALGVLDSYAGIPEAVLRKAAERGTKVHKAVELHLQGDLDELSLDPAIADYFYGYIKFERELGYRPRHSELRVHSAKFKFAGTLDLEGPDPKNAKRDAVIDIKTSRELMPTVGPQLAAYERAHQEGTGSKKKYRRYGLLLTPDSDYQLHEYTDSTDWSVFLACLTVHNYRERIK